MKRLLFLLIVALTVGLMAGAANAAWEEYLEDFETFTPDPGRIEDHPDWYSSSGARIRPGEGVAGSVGLSDDGAIFTWMAHPFSWADLPVGDVVIMGMDFEGGPGTAGVLDDDRVGWMHTGNSTTSDYIFAVQADNGGTGNQVENYWENGGGNNRNTIFSTSPVVGTWYRLRSTFTKLTDTSCSIDVSFVELNAAGDPISATEITGRVDDSSLSVPLYSMDYFTNAVQYPAYKNHSGAGNTGNADNAYFAIGSIEPTATLVAPIDWALIDLALLEWLRPEPMNEGDPGIVLVNVLFGTEPNLIVGLNGTILVEENYDGDSTGNFGKPLELDTVYYWRVDVIDPNYGAPSTFEGPTWSFITTVPSEFIVIESDGSTEVSEQDPDVNFDTYTIAISTTPTSAVTIDLAENVPSAIAIRIASGNDDGEEHVNEGGSIDRGSSDLELGYEQNVPDPQLVGLYFRNVPVSTAGAISSAYVEFEVDQVDSGELHLLVAAEKSADPDAISGTAGDLSRRVQTDAQIVWDVEDFPVQNAKHQTPDITAVIEEIVSDPDWLSGGNIMILVSLDPAFLDAQGLPTGQQNREVESYNGEAAAAPTLYINWAAPSQLEIIPSQVIITEKMTPVTITVKAIDDNVLERDPHSASIIHTVSTSDATYSAITIDDIAVSILENECGAWGFAPVDLNDDCVVDLADLAEFASQFGRCTDPHFPAICDDIR